MKMTLDELVNSHKPAPKATEERPVNKVVVSPLTNESLGYCEDCGVVSFCLVDKQCPVCAKRWETSPGVEILRLAIQNLNSLVEWVESLGPKSSWNVETDREPMHVRQTSKALLQTLRGILNRETEDNG